MAGYLLYFPGEQGGSLELLQRAGLDELASGDNVPTPEFRPVLQGGPDSIAGGGGHGLIMTWFHPQQPERQPRAGYFPKTQVWRACAADAGRGLAAGRFWMGYESSAENSPPTPEDLARPKQYEGIAVPLDDGNLWTVPVARHLPHENRLGADGLWERQVSEPFRAYFDQAVNFAGLAYDTLRGVPRRETIKDAIQLAVRGLSLNYLVNRDLVDFLGLLRSDEALFRVCGAAWEFDAWQELEALGPEKKNTRAT